MMEVVEVEDEEDDKREDDILFGEDDKELRKSISRAARSGARAGREGRGGRVEEGGDERGRGGREGTGVECESESRVFLDERRKKANEDLRLRCLGGGGGSKERTLLIVWSIMGDTEGSVPEKRREGGKVQHTGVALEGKGCV